MIFCGIRYKEKYGFCFDTDKDGAIMHISLNMFFFFFLLFECSGHAGMFEQFSMVTAKCTSSFIVTALPRCIHELIRQLHLQRKQVL